MIVSMKDAHRDALGREATVSSSRYVTDGTYIHDEGIPCVVCGPGAISDGAHGYDEFVPRKEVLEAAKLYAGFIYEWCK